MSEGEDFIRKRDALRKQAKAGLAHRAIGPDGLPAQRNYYQMMADDPLTPKKDRALWKQLADELTTRLGDGGDPTEGQGSLF